MGSGPKKIAEDTYSALDTIFREIPERNIGTEPSVQIASHGLGGPAEGQTGALRTTEYRRRAAYGIRSA